MNSVQYTGVRKARVQAMPTVAPITRAIRAALTVSATMLALSAPAIGMAGTCSYDVVSNTYACNGDFIQALPESGFVPPADLTLVLGNEVPTSVNPAPGEAGVEASWAGDVSVIAYAATGIATSGADGIHAYSADAATQVSNYGSIVASVAAAGVEALDVGAIYDVTLVNGGDAFANDASGSYGVVTANVFSISGDISIENQVDGTLGASAFDGDATAFSARAQGAYAAIEIGNEGVINADSVYGDAIGIFASGGDISVRNSGSVHASGYASAIGIDVSARYGMVDNSGTIVAEAAADSGGYVPAVGVRAFADDARVYNGEEGLISAAAATDADGGWARARAVYAVGFSDGVTVESDGDIQAYAQADKGRAEAHGIYAFGYGSAATVRNAGDIEVSARSADGGAYATGINSIGYGSGSNNADVVNAGSIHAGSEGAYAYAFGVLNLTRQRYGNAYFTNEGDIHAEASGNYATATGSLNLALRYGDATTTNTGIIDAVANGVSAATATGLYNYAQVYDAIVDNSGAVSATATGDLAVAVGIYNSTTLYGNTTTHNSGDIVAQANADTRIASAAGVVSVSELSVDVSNSADIDVGAYSVDGGATAVGLYARGTQTTTVLNYGDVSAHAQSVNDSATAYGAYVYGGFSGIGLLINGGTLSATASAGAGGYAYATGAIVAADVATIFNDVSASATATAGEGGTAVAIGGRTYGLNSAVNNYGDLSVDASAAGGVADATGASVYGYTSSSLYNVGDIGASADGALASATGAYSVGIFYAYAHNTGAISAQASGDEVIARGLYNASVFDAITVNTGSISAVAEGGLAEYGHYEALSFGVYNLAVYYNSIVDNSGSVSASASAMTDISGTDGFLVAKALGAVALSMYGYGETTITNTNSITASAETSQGYAGAWGAVARGGVYGTASIANDGLIASYAHTGIGSADAVGAYAGSLAGTASVVNHGDIIASARSERGIVNEVVNFATAVGAQVLAAYGSGEASIANYGNIEAHTSILGGIGYATGVEAYATYASVNNAAGANIVATVDAELFGGAFAIGVQAAGLYDVEVVNDGGITAYGHANAYSDGINGFYGAAGATGIYAIANAQGDVMVANNGDVIAVAIGANSVSWAQGGAGAVGINTYARYDASIVNTGNVTAIAESELGNVGAYGVIAHGKYSTHLVNEAGASIVASASVGSLYGDQYAGRAVSFGTQTFGNGMDYAAVYNAGSIVSHAVVTPDGTDTPIGSIAGAFGSTIGYNSGIAQATMTNVGSIEAAASAGFGYASAYGTFVSTQYDSAITNTGDILASASATGGNAFAVGSYAFSLHQSITYNCDAYGCDWANPIIDVDGGNSLIDNSGDIIATASARGGTGYSYGAVMLGALTAGITNTGHISAVTDADDALAVGVLANSFYGDSTLQNSGVIGAQATGDIASARGAELLGSNVQVDNTGTIIAAAYGADATATAVSIESDGSSTLINTGTISAIGDGERIAVSSIGSATASLLNQGSIIGAIRTGEGGGSLNNAASATWLAIGESDFGAGNNQIVNHGVIVMDDSTIRLGSETAGYASVAAMPFVLGNNVFDNLGTIAVSGNANVLDMASTLPMNNNGVISFVDGSADDVLTIVGDFGGQGAINVDVSGLNQTGDRLYVEGSVIESTVQTFNVNLTDLPAAAESHVALLSATDPLTDNFVLGNVQYAQNGFLAVDFSLDRTGSIISLGIAVAGLSGTGSLASAIAPGVQSLVNAQVGTWRQRMGVVPGAGPAGLAPWVRVFSDSGDVNPRHSANFGAGGSFGFHQSNHGWELGLDAQPTEHFAVGALIAKLDGSQSVTDVGSDRLDGTTFGLYATWFAGIGLYVDVSHRWTGIDARLRSAAATYETEASAQAFNVEAGFRAWTTAGGLNVVPQLQYTHTRVADIDTLSNGQGEFVNDGGVSSRARLGVAFDKSFQGAGFTWTPYGSVNALREFDGDYDHAINGGLLGTTSTEGTSAMVELGLAARRDRLSVTGGVNWTDGGALESVNGAQVSMRYSW